MFQPNNFFYFITLFSICTILGTYLLFSYKRNLLIILNAIACYLTAIRTCTEYYLPQVDTFPVASKIAIFHSLVTTVVAGLFYYVIWFYIRPFGGWKKERLINQLYLYVGLILPNIVIIYCYLNRKIYYFNPEKIDGYWQYSVHFDYFLTIPVLWYGQLINGFMLLIFIVSIIKERTHRLQKSILALSFIIAPLIYQKYFVIEGAWVIPNIGILFTAHLIIITWFVSEYRLFENNFKGTLNDILDSISDLAIFTDLKMGILHANQLAHQHFPNKIADKKNIFALIAEHSHETLEEIQKVIHPLVKKDKNNN